MALKMELFSYLPPMTEQQIAEQLRHVLESGYVVGIEFTESPQVADDYWSFWKLPFFKGATPQEVFAELAACRQAHPKAYVRLTGYDPNRQCQVLSFVVHRPAPQQEY